MAFAQRIVFLFFFVTASFGQRIPLSLFEPITVTDAQEIRIQQLDSIAEKTQVQQEELATLYVTTKDFDNAFEILAEMCAAYPKNFDYQYLYGGVSGILATELPRIKSLPYVRAMKTAFEQAVALKPKALDVQIVLVELYTELPFILGGSKKKALEKLKIVKSLSVVEGLLAEGYYFRATNKNKEALVAYLKAMNEINTCNPSLELLQDSYYQLGVLAYYLQKDMSKAACLFSTFIEKQDSGAAYPKSFAHHYLNKISDLENSDSEMESTLMEYDKLSSWIQNNFK